MRASTTFILGIICACIYYIHVRSEEVHLEQAAHHVEIALDVPEQLSLINCYIPESFLLSSYSIVCDIPLDMLEFEHLFSLQQGTLITREDIKQACRYIQAKNKFERIALFLFKDVSVKVHVRLTAYWTFNTIKVHGFLLNKEYFAQLYALQPGSLFDVRQHQHSLEKIKKFLEQQGYFEARVRDYLDFDQTHKMVTVHLNLEYNNPFTIQVHAITIQVPEAYNTSKKKILKDSFEKKIRTELEGVHYTGELIERQLRELKRYLIKKGFLTIDARCEESIDYAQKKVTLTFNLTAQTKKKFVFFGNYYFSTQELLDKVLLFGSSTPFIPPSLIIDELTDAYRKKGFWHVQVTVEEEPDRYVFAIYEGQRVRIGDIAFINVQAFNHDQLKKNVGKKVLGSYYDAKIFKQCIDQLVRYYQQQGFWDARIVEHHFNLHDHTTYTATVQVHEGKQVLINAIEVAFLPDAVVQGAFKKYRQCTHAVPVDLNDIYEQKKWLLRILHDKGFLHAHLNYELKEIGTKHILSWYCTTNFSPVTFGKTLITGMDGTL